QVRKTAFGSVDAVPHRHFEDPADAVASLKAEGAFVCALETTDGASSLFDVRFPLPLPLPHPPGKKNAVESNPSSGFPLPPPPGPENSAEWKPSRGLVEGGEGKSRVGVGVGDGGGVGVGLGEGGVVALVLGNEVTGVDERVLGLCDLVVEVPVFGLKNSLNVASAGTVVLYEVLRQWSLAGRLAGNRD
ncbi:unnamed protein product, partial [Laminaria digitata]